MHLFFIRLLREGQGPVSVSLQLLTKKCTRRQVTAPGQRMSYVSVGSTKLPNTIREGREIKGPILGIAKASRARIQFHFEQLLPAKELNKLIFQCFFSSLVSVLGLDLSTSLTCRFLLFCLCLSLTSPRLCLHQHRIQAIKRNGSSQRREIGQWERFGLSIHIDISLSSMNGKEIGLYFLTQLI